jgi:DNA polymerase III sliding clamp (beta) subunit (PCNA family)
MSVTIKLDRQFFAVRHAASKDETRFNVNSVAVRKNGAGRTELIATNGHILAIAEMSFGESPIPDGTVYTMSIQSVAQFELMARKSPVELTFEDGRVTACTPDATSAFDLLNCEYPNVDQVRPKKSEPVSEDERDSDIGLSCTYTATVAKIAKEFCRGRDSNPALRMTTYGPMRPMSFVTANVSLGTVEVVVMPLRLK